MHFTIRTSARPTPALLPFKFLFADMQYYVSILNANAKAFNQENGANQCVLTAVGYQEFYNGYPETQSECGEHLGFFDNMTISDEMKQANLVFIEKQHLFDSRYGRNDSPEALMQGKCYAYYRLEGAGKDGHSFKVDTSQC